MREVSSCRSMSTSTLEISTVLLRSVPIHSRYPIQAIVVEGRFVALDLRFVDISTVPAGLISKYHTYDDRLPLLTLLGLTDS
jgi:hypothetical protein